MAAVLTLLIVGVCSGFIIRAGATALEMTGLSRDAARFQALSAFFGAGFTTTESELVVNHPVRRRVIRDLIVVGQLGMLTAFATGVYSTISERPFGGRIGQYAIVLAALVGVWLLSRSAVVSRAIDATIRRTLRRAGVVKAMDYAQLLGVHEGYEIAEVFMESSNPLAGKSLLESSLRRRGVVVLGIMLPDGSFLGAPRGAAVIEPESTLDVYGERDCVRALLSGSNQERGGVATAIGAWRADGRSA